jgi:CRISPR/Cas system-associated endoribonuclease Cas2
MFIKRNSATYYVLEAMIPYTDANLKLTYKPNLFFNELEKIDRVKINNSKNAFYRSIQRGLIDLDSKNVPRITEKGIRALAPFQAKTINNASLMVIFDIPEVKRWQRSKLRIVLREFQFEQIQRSVWITKLDCAQYIEQEIRSLNLEKNIKLYESKEIV